MTKSKDVPLAVQIASAYQNAIVVLSNRTTAFGGNLTEALVRLGMGEKRYGAEIDQLAAIYAGISNDVIAPEGGRVHILRDVVVDESVDWNQVIDASFDTSVHDIASEIERNYPAKKHERVTIQDIVLVRFGDYIENTVKVLEWGKEHNLCTAGPRVIIEGVKKFGSLYKDLNKDSWIGPVSIISLEEFTLLSVGRRQLRVWIRSSDRGVGVRYVDEGGDLSCWFAFSRKKSLAA